MRPERSVHESFQAANRKPVVTSAIVGHRLRQPFPGGKRHRRPDARPETSSLARPPEHLQIVPRSHVDHVGDAARAKFLLAASSARSIVSAEGAGITRSTRLLALSFRIPVGSPDAPRTMAPPAASGVLLSTFAAASASEFARLMWPSMRLIHTGFLGAAASIHSFRGSSPPQFWWSQSPPVIQVPGGTVAAKALIRATNSSLPRASRSCTEPRLRPRSEERRVGKE